MSATQASETLVRIFPAMTQYIAPVGVAIVAIVLLTVPQAIWSERFVPRETTAEQKELAKRLEILSKKYSSFGDWVGTVEPMAPEVRKAARLVGDFSVRFQNKLEPEKVVTIMIACGHGTDLGIHTPDQCFIAQGFTMADEEREYTVDLPSGPADFTTCRFRKEVPGKGPQNIRIFWSFNESGNWFAPTNRMGIRTKPAAYKIYATTFLAKDTKEQPNSSEAIPFLREFLPLVHDTLFPPAGTNNNAAATVSADNNSSATSNSVDASKSEPASAK
jgi:hypothetical protein